MSKTFFPCVKYGTLSYNAS